MDLFIKNQLKSFKGKKYKKKDLINEKNYGDRKKNILPIIIKNNKIINQDIKNYSINQKIYRCMRIRNTLLLLNRLKLITITFFFPFSFFFLLFIGYITQLFFHLSQFSRFLTSILRIKFSSLLFVIFFLFII